MKYKRFEELPVWQDSMKLVKHIYQSIKLQKFSNDFDLINQIKRSVISVPSNIAEGFARKTSNEFLRFLDITLWSLAELKTQIYIAFDIWYLNKKDLDSFLDDIDNIEKQIKSLILYLNSNN